MLRAGHITNENSVLGTIPNGGSSLTYDYSSIKRKFIVGRPSNNLVTFFQIQGSQPIFDFDGDSKTDIGIFRPSDGSWWYSRSSDSAFRVFSFGASGDRLTPGDYSGNGKAGIAVFRPSSGEWYFQRSEDNSFFSFPFGTSGDVPVPSDFDGDGKFDTAVFRPSTATWFVNRTTAGILIANFGASGDRPIPNSYVPQTKKRRRFCFQPFPPSTNLSLFVLC